MLAPFTEGRHDRQMQALGVCSLERYGALIDRLRDDGHEVAYSRRGSIDVAFDETRARLLAGDAKALAADGVSYAFYEDDDARRFAPAVDPRVKAILEIPAHGAVGVADLTAALWKSAEARGARLTAASATRWRTPEARSGRDDMRRDGRAARGARRWLLGRRSRPRWPRAAARAARARSTAGAAPAVAAAGADGVGTGLLPRPME
jgi:hypothetical protein